MTRTEKRSVKMKKRNTKIKRWAFRLSWIATRTLVTATVGVIGKEAGEALLALIHLT
jgi:hypothetical protein